MEAKADTNVDTVEYVKAWQILKLLTSELGGRPLIGKEFWSLLLPVLQSVQEATQF